MLNQAARTAIEAKDYGKLRAMLVELKPLLPGNPRILFTASLPPTQCWVIQRQLWYTFGIGPEWAQFMTSSRRGFHVALRDF